MYIHFTRIWHGSGTALHHFNCGFACTIDVPLLPFYAVVGGQPSWINGLLINHRECSANLGHAVQNAVEITEIKYSNSSQPNDFTGLGLSFIKCVCALRFFQFLLMTWCLCVFQDLQLEYVHGYRGFDSRNNLFYISDGAEIVFHTAGAGVVQNLSTGETHLCSSLHVFRGYTTTGVLACIEISQILFQC